MSVQLRRSICSSSVETLLRSPSSDGKGVKGSMRPGRHCPGVAFGGRKYMEFSKLVAPDEWAFELQTVIFTPL